MAKRKIFLCFFLIFGLLPYVEGKKPPEITLSMPYEVVIDKGILVRECFGKFDTSKKLFVLTEDDYTVGIYEAFDPGIVRKYGFISISESLKILKQKRLKRLKHKTKVLSVSLSREGRLLAVGSEGRIYIWNVKKEKCLKVLKGHKDKVYSVCFSPDNRFLASGSAGTVHIWDVKKGSCLKVLKGHRGKVLSVCFSPDGKLLASGGDRYDIHIWKWKEGRCLKVLKGKTEFIKILRFSPDGRFLISGDLNKVCIWNVRTKKFLTQRRMIQKPVLFYYVTVVKEVMLKKDYVRIVSMLQVSSKQAIQKDFAKLCSKSYIKVTEYSAPGQEKYNAIRAATVIAQRDLLEKIEGSRAIISDKITYEIEDIISTNILESVLNAPICKCKYYPDGHAEISISFKPTPLLSKTVSPYDGLIIDARNAGLRPALFNRIITKNKKVIFDISDVAFSTIKKRGLCGYALSINEAKKLLKKWGSNNPLVVKAIGVINDTDVQISVEDALEILIHNKKTNFLNQGKVVFVF